MASDNLKVSLGSLTKYNELVTGNKLESGTLYFAKDTDNRAYIYLNGYNIIPKFLDLRNGGLGADLTGVDVKSYAIYMRGISSYDTTYVNPAEGAFYALKSGNNIQKPLFGTLPVSVGGTGVKTLAANAIVYGNGTGSVKTLAPSTNGYVLVTTGAAPAYVKPQMSWTAGTANGPVFNFKFNGQTFVGVAIPAAGSAASGIITSGDQNIAGIKTFDSNMKTQSIYPVTSKNSSLGYWTAPTDHKLWSGVYSRYYAIFDEDGYQTGQLISSTKGTTTVPGYSGLSLGNSIERGKVGNARGILWLYGQNKGRASIEYGNYSEDSVFNLPNIGAAAHYLTPTTEGEHSGGDSSYYIPFYASTGSTTVLTFNNSFKLQLANGDTSTTPGRSELILGNASGAGTSGNTMGKLFLYGSDTGFTAISPNEANVANEIYLSLPAASGELVYHVENDDQGGSGKLIYVSKDGQILEDTTTNTSNIKLMYLNKGTLIESAATKGSGTKLMYLNKGTFTESGSTIASGTKLMYLNAGTLTASTSSVANGKKQLMYLDTGELKASDAGEGSNTKFIYLKSGAITASTATVGSGTKLMYLNAGTFTPSSTTVGSTTKPVYLSGGEIVEANGYDTLLTAFSGSDSASDNTASITVGGTTKTATIIGGVSNSWANGTTSGPTITTTVNGKAGSAKAIPSASYSYSGIITTGNQTVKGVKTFASGLKVAGSNSTSDCATFSYDASTDTLTISFP